MMKEFDKCQFTGKTKRKHTLCKHVYNFMHACTRGSGGTATHLISDVQV